jgi:hypothetical protein
MQSTRLCVVLSLHGEGPFSLSTMASLNNRNRTSSSNNKVGEEEDVLLVSNLLAQTPASSLPSAEKNRYQRPYFEEEKKEEDIIVDSPPFLEQNREKSVTRMEEKVPSSTTAQQQETIPDLVLSPKQIVVPPADNSINQGDIDFSPARPTMNEGNMDDGDALPLYDEEILDSPYEEPPIEEKNDNGESMDTIQLLVAAGNALEKIEHQCAEIKEKEGAESNEMVVIANDNRETALVVDAVTLTTKATDSSEVIAARSPVGNPTTRASDVEVSPERKLAASATAAMKDFRTMFGKFTNNDRRKKSPLPSSAEGVITESTKESPTASGDPIDESSKKSPTQTLSLPTLTGKLDGKLDSPGTRSKEADDNQSQSSPGSTSAIFLRGSNFLGSSKNDDRPELAHKFKDHTFRKPTKCDICEGLLVGLFSQGLQCQCCGMNVHHGRGKGEHGDCRAEAILACCKGPDAKRGKENEQPIRLQQTFKEVRELAKNSPGFLREVKEQMDKDLRSHAKKMVVKAGTEEQRSKNLHRLRERLVPFLKKVKAIEQNGNVAAVASLLYYHTICVAIMAAFTGLEFTLSLWPTKEGPSIQAVVLYSATVLRSIHVTLLIASIGIRWSSFVFQRKAVIFNQFLSDVGTINAEQDIGISVATAAVTFRYWSDRFVLSSLTTCCMLISFWYFVRSVQTAVDDGIAMPQMSYVPPINEL